MGLLDDAIREHLDLKRKRGADPGEIERLEREALGPVRREPTSLGVGGVPHLEVQPEHQPLEPHPEHDDLQPRSEPHPAEPHVEPGEPPAAAPKRGFLRRNRSVPLADSAPMDFAHHLEADDDDPFAHDHLEAAPLAEPHIPPVAPAGATEDTEPPPLILDSPPPERPRFSTEPPGLSDPHDEPSADHDPEAQDTTEEHPLAAEPAATSAPSPPAESHPQAHDQPAAANEPEPGATHEWDVESAFVTDESSHSQASVAQPPAPEDVLEETPEFLQDTPDHDRLWFEQRPPRDFDFDG